MVHDFASKFNHVIPLQCGSNVIFDPLHNSCCDFDEEKNTKLSEFSSILEFMRRVPIPKALTKQHLVYKSHVKRFWKHATYDEANKVINSVVKQYEEKKPIVVTEALVREVLDFPDDVDSPTKFPERMVKGCTLRMGYDGALNNTNYLKSKFQKPYKFIVHSILQALSHCNGGYDAMQDYQMNMITALVLNKK
ncbi:hypothetical protein HanPSC8_Chr16g0743831 [Helianthus annuus]|nr:hypothetical protein HanPSC8_Chr16g0743831 [Helianthus annuus]